MEEFKFKLIDDELLLESEEIFLLKLQFSSSSGLKSSESAKHGSDCDWYRFE
jgi:hypothetical protein